MKLFYLLMLSFITSAAIAQTRYFQFTVACGHGNWQDTSFIAATSDQTVIDSVLANLARPLEQRNFINGPIAAGNGGHNHNAGHWFKWHFIPGQWDLVELAIEVCDGCPYSDVDADTAYWFNTVGQFCPWSGQPLKEVSAVGVGEEQPVLNVRIYPNPAEATLFISTSGNEESTVELFNLTGERVLEIKEFTDGIVDVSSLPGGMYKISITANKGSFNDKIVIVK